MTAISSIISSSIRLSCCCFYYFYINNSNSITVIIREMRLFPPLHWLGLRWRCCSLVLPISNWTDKEQHLQTSWSVHRALTTCSLGFTGFLKAWHTISWTPTYCTCCWQTLTLCCKISSFTTWDEFVFFNPLRKNLMFTGVNIWVK